jgi:hypothetical protein
MHEISFREGGNYSLDKIFKQTKIKQVTAMQIAENKGEEKMAISRKNIAAAVSLFLMLTMAASMILLPVGGQIN